MKQQNYSNHIRLVPGYHYVLYGLISAMLTGSVVCLYRHWQSGLGLLVPSLLITASIIILLLALFARSFALKAQDRAIRAEENLRYFAITGNLFDNRLRLGQIIALRFAPNNELPDLAHRAAEENLSAKEIKKAIVNWREDHHRV